MPHYSHPEILSPGKQKYNWSTDKKQVHQMRRVTDENALKGLFTTVIKSSDTNQHEKYPFVFAHWEQALLWRSNQQCALHVC